MTSRDRETPQGEPRGNGTPALSVVIASVNGYRYIAQCLHSLAKQCQRDRGEVIVVEGSGDDTATRVAQEFPWVRLIPCSTPKPIPELRSIGIREAKAPIVATTEDHCVFDEDWYGQMLRANESNPDSAWSFPPRASRPGRGLEAGP